MEVYVEYEMCYLTKLNENGMIDDNGNALVKLMLFPLKRNKLYYKDGKFAIYNFFHFTDDYRFIYINGNDGKPYTWFRVKNISSKPIIEKQNKIVEYKELTSKINDLIKERKELLEV